MKNYIRSTQRVFLLSVCLLTTSLAAVGSELQSVQREQENIQETTHGFAQQLKPILLELGELGASEEDIILIRQTMGELTQLTDQEMVAILQLLGTALTDPDAAGAGGQLEAAFQGQEKVVDGLRKIFERLRTRQTELSIASKAEGLRRRQAENQHRTEMLDAGEGDAVSAQAEQRALEEAVEELVRELKAIQDSEKQEGADVSAVDEETLQQMRELAEEASQQMDAEAYSQAAQTQKELGEMLADLAAETGLEQSSEEFLEDLVRQLRALLARQRSLREVGLSEAVPDQERIAIETETLRVPTENVNAPAGFQVAGAAKAMRTALLALSSDPIVSPESSQLMAIQSLEKAIELLEQNLEEMEESEGEGEGDEMAALAEMYRQAENLRNRQNQQNSEGGSQSNQAQIARETAELQQEAAEASPEATRSLGRAAARMAEALDPELSEAEREAVKVAAAEQLASAVEAIQSEGRARRNTPPGQGSGGQSMENVVLDDELLGPSELSPAERAAIESARREPVAAEYAPLVEAYFDNLSRQSGQ
jgi:hypothetical protein